MIDISVIRSLTGTIGVAPSAAKRPAPALIGWSGPPRVSFIARPARW
jgi:hypothetical protein